MMMMIDQYDDGGYNQYVPVLSDSTYLICPRSAHMPDIWHSAGVSDSWRESVSVCEREREIVCDVVCER